MSEKKILVTGGAGYIGSHTCVALLENGYEVTVIDNLSNSSQESLKRVEKITKKNLKFHNVDLRDEKKLEEVFKSDKFFSVIHFAGLKAVGESVEKPDLYYENNVLGSILLLKLMLKHEVNNMVFSSSATVYGNPEKTPIKEDFPLLPTNPYGRTKLMIEQMLTDINFSRINFNVLCLRYFNPIGAHDSGLIGEDPRGIPNNLVPYIAQVVIGLRDYLNIYGGDYPTQDGTAIRDYIHVMDLAEGHLKALEKIETSPGFKAYNLGTGKGYSVFEVLKAFEKACGKKIDYKIVDRRPGDATVVFTDTDLAAKELKWIAKRDINKMCEDVWRWQTKNPTGYTSGK